MTGSEVLQFVSDRLRAVFEVKRVVLFGSHANGKATPESDFDVLAIVETEVPFTERQGMALIALGERNFPIDLLVFTAAEAAESAKLPGSAIYWAEREGRELVAQ